MNKFKNIKLARNKGYELEGFWAEYWIVRFDEKYFENYNLIMACLYENIRN